MLVESPIVFMSNDKQLVGIYHQAAVPATKAVVFVVGGPQTRVGSHRQFLLLAREFANQGIDVLRFDYTGAGDSEGEITEFTDLTSSISAAVDTLLLQNHQLNEITLWGLCDAASAILIYLAKTKDERINKMILLNPWVRQASTEAQVYLKSYYIRRLFQKDFWKKLFSGNVKARNTVKDIKKFQHQSKHLSDSASFVDLMLYGAETFTGKISFILSGNDLTAEEFKMLTQSDERWKKILKQPMNSIDTVKGANHTFSKELWHQQVVELSFKAINDDS